ncbi:hypothetical protein [Streptomyces sp. 7N604]|uniref:hypothetical protein n=1 Tax=Streptomyces sp. 7N604 TaxID=3457415 RepID=UPI003FD61699
MPTRTDYPMRVRLYRGRSVHAARELTISGGVETACDYVIDMMADNHWLDDDAGVTCGGCLKAMKKEN